MQENKQNSLSDSTDNSGQDKTVQTSWPVMIMIGYLYFAQGFILSISGTITFTYPQLPDYFTLSLFSLSVLPFSFKFLTAPLLEKYSYLPYGKRKTWIISSQLLTTFMVFICSFYTKLEQAKAFAFINIFMYLGLSLQDISLDALCLKELKSPKMMSMIQGSCQSSGVIIGSLLLLKGTSLQFAKSIGLTSPITTTQTFFIWFAIIMLIPTLIIHFRFKQSYSEAEERTTTFSVRKVYSLYKYYFKRNYRYCQVLIFSLIYHQGFNFFAAGYQFQLIHAGFSRNTLNTIDNFQNIILTALMFILGKNANYFGYQKSFFYQMLVNWIVFFIIWMFFPTGILAIVIVSFILGFLSQWDFLLGTILCGDFPESGITGMLYTMSASASNFGRNKFIHTAILKVVPWRIMAIIGLVIQLAIIFVFTPRVIKLIESGQTKIELDQNKNQQPSHNELNQQVQNQQQKKQQN